MGREFVEELCAYRCTNTHGLGFEDTRFPEGVETCADKCKLIYASLLEKVKEPWDEAADVENAKKVVEENDQQLRDEARAKQKIRIKLITSETAKTASQMQTYLCVVPRSKKA